MSRYTFTFFKTNLGRCGIAWREAGDAGTAPVVTALQLPEASGRLIARQLGRNATVTMAEGIPPLITDIIARIQRHLAGEIQDFRDIEVNLVNAGPFAREVYRALRNIPSGRTVTYGELARSINRPGAARAVGQAMARNPIPLIIPCHRVLAVGNRPGGFSAPGGVACKAKMLAIEGTLLRV